MRVGIKLYGRDDFMIKIRNKIFETNSSSMDRYDDDYYDDSPSYGLCPQFLYIQYKMKDGVNAESCIDKIWDTIVQDDSATRIDKFLEKYFDNFDEWVLDDVNEDFIVLRVSYLTWYLGTDECDGFPDTECKSETKKQLLEILHNIGLVEIESIESMYGSEPDFKEVMDNLY